MASTDGWGTPTSASSNTSSAVPADEPVASTPELLRYTANAARSVDQTEDTFWSGKETTTEESVNSLASGTVGDEAVEDEGEDEEDEEGDDDDDDDDDGTVILSLARPLPARSVSPLPSLPTPKTTTKPFVEPPPTPAKPSEPISPIENVSVPARIPSPPPSRSTALQFTPQLENAVVSLLYWVLSWAVC